LRARLLLFGDESLFGGNAVKDARRAREFMALQERAAFTRRAQNLLRDKNVSLRVTTNPSTGAMNKKKTKKTAGKTAARKKNSRKTKKETNPAEVRQEISKLVAADATDMAEAVIGEGLKGQLAPVKFLFEMAKIFPMPEDGTQATEQEDSLAKMLLERLKPPVKVQAEEETEKETGEAAVTQKRESAGEATAVSTGNDRGESEHTVE
jgi:hypothetical protein